MPTYNGEKTVAKSIRSVLEQSYQNWELIIVNDCSTDGTLDVLREFADSDDRIRIVNNQENIKLPASLNAGFSQVTGEFLTWTSDDNAYHKDAFETMIRTMRENPEYDMVYADFNVVDLAGNVLWQERKKEPDEIRYVNTIGACFLYKKTLADCIGSYDQSLFLAEDYEYWIRAFLHGNLHHIDEILYDYGWHDKSLTLTRQKQIQRATLEAKQKHEEALLERCSNQKERNRFYLEMLSLVEGDEYKTLRRKYYKESLLFALNDIFERTMEKCKHYLHLPLRAFRRICTSFPEKSYYRKNAVAAKSIAKQIDKEFLIMTIAFNNSEVIKKQIEMLRKHCKSDYQYAVFDNSSDWSMRDAIQDVCKEEGVLYYSLPKLKMRVNPSESHGVAINYAMKNIVMNSNGAKSILLLDHDIFPYRDFDMESLSKGQDLYGMLVELGEGKYIWPGFFFCKKKLLNSRMMDFKPGYGGDTGSGNRPMLYENLDFEKMSFADLKRPDINDDKTDDEFGRQRNTVDILDETWIHFVGASDWMGIRNFEEKYSLFNRYVQKMIDNQ